MISQRSWGRGALGLAAAGLLCGCSGVQSVLDPAADQAAHIHLLWDVMVWTCAAFYLFVMAFLAWALWRRRRTSSAAEAAGPASVVPDLGLNKATAIWTAVIAIGIGGLTLTSFLTDRSLAGPAGHPMKIKVTAKQWWWDIEYQNDTDPSQTLHTANELHLPLGRTAVLELQGQDVIHSFWLPNLHGKEDLIPGRTNFITLTPRRLGRFRGQCAEFCGLQHAHMAFDVTVDSPAQFEQWRRQGLTEARAPATPQEISGQQVFLNKACVMCHQISGTPAGSRAGPDLTHLASRPTIAAGTLPNTPRQLASWIADPQAIKPGTNMPVVPMSRGELNDLVAYLSSLK